ncbi:helix-turn-helix transcriptional regulator (plasmid) [Embleya sp. NBC_00888]|uniref:helix-turn-helix transcriptional regulator n=1 Tax=Embleya sp. NBC_00888 TaxID=2975960 RepID=UPI002F90A4E2|nr:helix-turn-helix transcriptional regulator [Embleya sp. NBC_00888]
MNSDNALGAFLRARREAVDVDAVGIVHTGRRRTPGLRREEVAVLAGVSTDYYVRLEQGRERGPSDQVLDALARTLRLGDDAAEHLRRLARPTAHRRPRARRAEQVSPHLTRMMQTWDRQPALVLGRYMDILASNTLGSALFEAPERNLLRLIFLDPAGREFYPDWEKAARNTVASLRACAGDDPGDPALISLVGELSVRSPDFARLWARHEVRGKSTEAKRFRHPKVGELVLAYEALTINSAPGQQLVVYQAEPGSPTEESLRLLGSLSAAPPARP